MTRDEAIFIVLQRCGRRENDQVLQAACVTELALVQQAKLEGADFKPWFLLSEMLRTVTPSDGEENRVLVPSNFLEEQEEGSLWILPSGSTKYCRLVRDDPDYLEERWADAVMQPKNYALVKNYFVLFPTPDKQYPLKVRCYLREAQLTYQYGTEQTEIANNRPVTNAWLTEAADWLIGELGSVIAGQYIKDAATQALFEKSAADAKQRLYVQHVSREEMNRDRSAGDD